MTRPLASSRRGVRLLAAALLLAAVALVVVLDADGRPTLGEYLFAGLLALGFAQADAHPLHSERDGQTYTFSLSELPLVAGLLLCPAPLVVVARVAGGTAALLLTRHQRGDKLAFNVALYAYEAALAATVFLHLGGRGATGSALLAGLTAAGAAALASSLAVTVVIRLATGRWDAATIVAFLRSGAGTVLVSGSLGVLLGEALLRTPVAAVPCLVVSAATWTAYRGHVDLRHRHENLMLIYDFATGIDLAASHDRRLHDVLTRTRDVLRSGHAELLTGTGGRVRRRWLDPTGTLREEVRDTDAIFAAVVTAGPVRAGRGGPVAAARGLRDLLAVPITVDGEVGVLLVADRISDVSSYTEHDVKLLGSVAVQAATALVNGRLLDRLTHESRHDGLTGLANRTTFQEHLRSAVSADGRLAVLLLDLDRFKEVNDTLGHHVGDLLIREVASRLRTATPASATVARLGGDEFAVLLPGSDTAHARQVATAVWTAVAQPCRLESYDLDLQCSIGISTSPEHGLDPTSLLKRADTAMYAAKRGGSGIETYDPQRDEHSPRRLVLASQVRTASDDGEMYLAYQPQVSVDGGELVGVEALMRWRHPEYGLVGPGEFIPVAEQSGAIAELSRWALTEAVGQAARWRDAGVLVPVSVNLSMRNLADGEVADHVRDLLSRYGLDPALLTLEVTESQVMADPRRTLRVLHGLAGLGVDLSIDDFGTGYSSLSYLRQLPVDEIKVDRSFMAGLVDGTQETAIVRAVVDLAHALSMRVVAEGVEDAATLARLRELGCHRAQGFLFARAMPPEEVLPWAALRSGGRSARSRVRPLVPLQQRRVLHVDATA